MTKGTSKIYVLGGVGVALIYNLVSLGVARHIAVGPPYFDISLLCHRLGEADTTCKAGALEAGYTMVIGVAVALVLAVAVIHRFYKPAPAASVEQAFPWLAVAVCVLVGIHVAREIFGIQHATHLRRIEYQATLISLENLLWPLLIQLSIISRSWQRRIQYFSLFLPLAALSPFRGVLFAGLVFGLALPLAEAMFAQVRALQTGRRRWTLFKYASVAACVVVIGLYGLYFLTEERFSNADLAAVKPDSEAALTAKVAQRLAYPLYQAGAAKVLSASNDLPNGLDEILRKLRLSSRPNLNEYLVNVTYGPGVIGEATSLYYGEAAANSLSYPVLWIIVAPLALVALWLFLRNRGIDAGALVGIAIWRGSLGGAFTVLPALLIQVAMLILLARLPGAFSSSPGSPAQSAES